MFHAVHISTFQSFMVTVITESFGALPAALMHILALSSVFFY